ncbi:MAG: hypothetical protein KDA52_24750 [Planctomycetaceae bacterium]|nr:hypothetical protein [Planctomycetaceae bacterium]
MKTIWEISPAEGDEGFTVEDWMKLIEARSELQTIPPATRPNPFKPGEMMTVRAPATSVNVHLDESCVGSVAWAMDESILLDASPNQGMEALMLPVVQMIASELKAKVTEYHYE